MGSVIPELPFSIEQTNESDDSEENSDLDKLAI